MEVERRDSGGALRMIETETYYCPACGDFWDVVVADSLGDTTALQAVQPD
jgi:hypothetical protein